MTLAYAKELIEPNVRLARVMQLFCNYFNNIFKNEIVTFVYTRLLKATNNYIQISNLPRWQELSISLKAHEDNPILTKYDNAVAGCVFVCPDYNKTNDKHNNFLHTVTKEFNVRSHLYIVEKHPRYYQTFCLGFLTPEVSIQEEQMQILQSNIRHSNIIKNCISRFKTEVCPILEEDIPGVDFQKFKGPEHESQKSIIINHISQQQKIDFLLKTNVIKQDEVFILQNTKLIDIEEKCLKLYSQGQDIEEIADTLFLSVDHASNYISDLKSKLQCQSRTELQNRSKQLTLLNIIDD